MSDASKHLKDQFNRGKQLGEDPNISAGDAVRQLFGEARAEFQSASAYTKMRAIRKQMVAKRLQEARKKCGLTQQEAAKRTGINVITLSGYEIGKNEPNIEALVRFADLYEVSMDYLSCRTDE